MTWLAWRQFRAQTALAAIATLAVTVVLVATRHHVASAPDPGNLASGYRSLRLLGTALVGLPAFVGAFWGAPLLARELEAGTHRLVWMQSVSRARWLAVKLGVVGAVTTLVAAVFSVAFTWWSLPFDHVGSRIGTANFGQRGLAPVAYALFAVMLGTLFGAVMRHTLPAMAATLVTFFVVRFAVQLLVRPHLITAVSATRPSTVFGSPEQSSASGAWILSTKTFDGAGHVLSPGAVDGTLSRACGLTRASSADAWASCVHRLGIHDVVKMQPASRFWALQGWESAIFVAMAIALGGACFWWVRHRAA